MKTVACVAFLACVACPPRAWAAPAEAGTLSVRAGVGLGLQARQPTVSQTDPSTAIGVGFQAAVGAHVSPRIAVLGELRGSVAPPEDTNLGRVDRVHLVFGPGVQGWVSDRLWVSGGVGLSMATSRDTVSFGGTPGDPGYAVNLAAGAGAGMLLAQRGRHALAVALDVGAGFHEDSLLFTSIVSLGWLFH